MTEQTNLKYIPGVCNIGIEERKIRRNIGVFGAVLTLIFLFFSLVLDLRSIYRIIIFLPAFMSALGFLQYKMHFCAEFGILGVYNFDKAFRKKISIMESEFLKQDRIKALKIIVYSLLVAIFITLIALVI